MYCILIVVICKLIQNVINECYILRMRKLVGWFCKLVYVSEYWKHVFKKGKNVVRNLSAVGGFACQHFL